MFIPKIMIGTTTSIAACLLLWIGINEQTTINVQKSDIIKIPSIELAETMDEYTALELQSEDVEEVILDEILTVYVSDIESGNEINPLLEKEITNYLLQENADEEVL
jgi:phosphatidylglycerophosphatase A